jgi:hypothetical protein
VLIYQGVPLQYLHFEVREFLKSTSGANRNQVDRYGSTPLMEADGDLSDVPGGDMIGA